MATFWGDANMAEYRAYIMDKDGLISRAIGPVCPDDKTAMEHAKQFVDGHDVEVWKRECRIATFSTSARRAALAGGFPLESILCIAAGTIAGVPRTIAPTHDDAALMILRCYCA
jgi:hypothetical protein